MLAYSALLYWAAVTGFVHTRPLAAPREDTPRPRRETYGMTDADLARHAAVSANTSRGRGRTWIPR